MFFGPKKGIDKSPPEPFYGREIVFDLFGRTRVFSWEIHNGRYQVEGEGHFLIMDGDESYDEVVEIIKKELWPNHRFID